MRKIPNNTPEQLYDDIKALHAALCDTLMVAAFERGWNHEWVRSALDALARHPELPVPRPISIEQEKPLDRQAHDAKDKRRVRDKRKVTLAQMVKEMEKQGIEE